MNARPTHPWHAVPRLLCSASILFALALPVASALAAPRPPPPPPPAPAPVFGTDFRSLDGSGNRDANDTRGTPGSAFLRLTPPDYADGVDAPAGAERDSTRAISQTVCAQEGPVLNRQRVSDLFYQWGQFLDHDLDLSNAADPAEPFDIPVPAGDPWFDPAATGTQVIPLDRTVYDYDEHGVRQKQNAITAWIDASMVYGSDAETALELRALDGTGRLRTSAGDLLPIDPDFAPFFVAGDIRVNEQPGLIALQTLFVREHNYWAGQFAAAQPGLDDEGLYQRARAVVIAEIQRITYEEFLPVLLGPSALPPYRGYRPEVNPAIANEFATAAYRFGHSMVSAEVIFRGPDLAIVTGEPLALRDAFFNPQLVIDYGLDAILRGIAVETSQALDAYIIDDLRNFLFGPPGAGGLDLAALNLQRGRDHGLPGYNDARRALGLPARASFAALTRDPVLRERLAAAYASVDDLDLWLGILAEEPVRGALIGETGRLIIADQFRRLRDADRFWYERYLPRQIARQLERTRLSDVIRRHTAIGNEINDQAFYVPPPRRPRR